MTVANPVLKCANTLTWRQAIIWLTLAVSCVVFVEPAPYDALVLLMLAVFFSLNLRVPSELNPAIFLMALFTLGNFLGALTSEDPESTVRPLITRTYMVVSWILFVAVISIRPESVMRVVWSGYTFAALLAAIWGTLEYYDLLPGAMIGDAFGRAKGPFKDPNVFGPFLVPVAIHLVSRSLSNRNTALVIDLLKLFIVAFGLFLSFSRGAWMNFGLSFGLFMALSIATSHSIKDRLRLVILVVFLVLGVGLSLSWAVNNTAAGQRFADRATIIKSYDVETGGRFYTQGKAVQEIGSRPLGIGPGMSTAELGMEPHNLYLHTAVEGGWIAAVSFYLFVLLTLYRGLIRSFAHWRLQVDLHVVLAVTCGTLFQSLFIDSTHWRHLWLIFAMLWALTIAVDRSREVDLGNVMSKDRRRAALEYLPR